MVQNSLGRFIPEIYNGKKRIPYTSTNTIVPTGREYARPIKTFRPGDKKLIGSLRDAIIASGLKDGMTISTHHHLRNGDLLLNAVVKILDELGIGNITIASSSIHPVHAEIIPYIRKGVITSLECGVNGLIGELATKGELDIPIIVRSHGGRARSMMTGEVRVDVAFIAAPCCDEYGNMNGYYGKSACGSLGYSHVDARYADKVIAVTDNLVQHPVSPIAISQTCVDYVVAVESLGDPSKIVSTTTKVTKDPIGLMIARNTAEVIEASGLLRDGFSFQTGAGGTSLAVAENVRKKMLEKQIKGSFGSGGITGYFVDMLNEGLFQTLMDVQCFDLNAVKSIGESMKHQEISADLYANPFNMGSIVNMLDVVILGATEIDVNFNVNVNTESNGYLLHNTGGHTDTAAGAKLAIIVAPSIRGRLPIIMDNVITVTTPGENIDIIVTERGIAVNDKHPELKKELLKAKLPVKDIHDIKKEITDITGVPRPVQFTDEIAALIEYRDGSIIDAVRRVKD